MTDKPRAADESAPGGTAPRDRADGNADRIVVRDKRRIDPTGDKPKITSDSPGTRKAGDPAAEKAPAAADQEHPDEAAPAPEPTGPTADEVVEGEIVVEVEAPAETADVGEPVEGGPAEAEPVEAEPVERPLGAELEALRTELDERTRDLQRVSAEYANYRKRVDRDRGVVAEQTTGAVLAALLPVLDDLDRARDHGDLVGPFGSVAEQLIAALGKFGLNAFGEKGDPFDPTRHEAVAHQTSADVTEPTCVDVMRRGYLLGDRLLRAAMVAVADPE